MIIQNLTVVESTPKKNHSAVASQSCPELNKIGNEIKFVNSE